MKVGLALRKSVGCIVSDIGGGRRNSLECILWHIPILYNGTVVTNPFDDVAVHSTISVLPFYPLHADDGGCHSTGLGLELAPSALARGLASVEDFITTIELGGRIHD